LKAAAPPKFIVAFSGGLDSTVLLHLCGVFFGPEALLAVHVNHGLQASAKKFEARARQTCRDWGISLRIKRLKASPPKGESIEAWAREARYKVLSELAELHGIAHIFTAHHQDDQIETLLIALSRGAGLEGLRGIAPSRELGRALNRELIRNPGKGAGSSSVAPDRLTGLRSITRSASLYRPLLDCPRSALLSYALEHNLHWIEDPTNQDAKYLRNRIRIELMPTLRKTLPGFAQQATRSMAHLRRAAGLLDMRTSVPPELTRALSRRELRALGDAEQATALRAWLRGQDLNPPSEAKLKEINKQLIHGKGPHVAVLHEGRKLRRDRDLLWIEKGVGGDGGAKSRPKKSLNAFSEKSELEAPVFKQDKSSELLSKTPQGWIWHLPEFRGSLLIKNKTRGSAGEPNTQLSRLDQVHIAPPRSTLKMQLELKTPRKTLKNLFQSAGIPAEVRKRLPCVIEGQEVLFVAGLGTAPNSPWKFEFLPDL
jgi:tRNA(Ile)-lysidine synthase